MIIAVVGGIASGKSSVMNTIKNYYGDKADYFSCDQINSEMLADPEYINIINKEFGAAKDGVVDKKLLGSIIFNNESERKRLNAIAHPIIKERLIKKIEASVKNLIFVEVPLFNESGLSGLFDKIWYIYVDKAIRVSRLMKRDNIDEIRANAKLASQSSDSNLNEIADEIINNNKDMDTLVANTTEVMRKYVG